MIGDSNCTIALDISFFGFIPFSSGYYLNHCVSFKWSLKFFSLAEFAAFYKFSYSEPFVLEVLIVSSCFTITTSSETVVWFSCVRCVLSLNKGEKSARLRIFCSICNIPSNHVSYLQFCRVCLPLCIFRFAPDVFYVYFYFIWWFLLLLVISPDIWLNSYLWSANVVRSLCNHRYVFFESGAISTESYNRCHKTVPLPILSFLQVYGSQYSVILFFTVFL